MENYYIYGTREEILSLSDEIRIEESIGDAPGDVSDGYSRGRKMADGRFALLSDAVTDKYVTDRQAVPLTAADFPSQIPFA